MRKEEMDSDADFKELYSVATHAATFGYRYTSLVRGRRQHGNLDVMETLLEKPPSVSLLEGFGYKYGIPGFTLETLRKALETRGAVQPRYRNIVETLVQVTGKKRKEDGSY